MKEIIEVVFEDIKLENLSATLIAIMANSVITNYQVTNGSNHLEIAFESSDVLYDTINSLPDGAIYISLSPFSFDTMNVEKLGLQVYKYCSKYDLSIDVDENIVKTKYTILDLKIWSENISKRLNAQKYFCGYEPAVDVQTRFFSNDRMGPLKKWNEDKANI